jgi:hypothetical protein
LKRGAARGKSAQFELIAALQGTVSGFGSRSFVLERTF